MIAVAIMIVLISITVATVSFSADDGAASGARDIQSFTEGARDRAIFRKKPTGIRLVLNANGPTNAAGNPTTVATLTYIGTPAVYSGRIFIREFDSMGAADAQTLSETSSFSPPTYAQWERMRQFRGLLDYNIPMRIKIIANGREELLMMAWEASSSTWKLTRPYAGPLYGNLQYELELLPSELANQLPRELPQGIAINLNSSKIPSYWRNGNQYTPYMDILFSPRGTGIGSASASGLIHLHVAELEDIERVGPGSLPGATALGNPRNKGTERVVTINPVTGGISTSLVNRFVDADQNDVPDGPYDPYLFAVQGRTAQ